MANFAYATHDIELPLFIVKQNLVAVDTVVSVVMLRNTHIVP